jgi:hypothetical protein
MVQYQQAAVYFDLIPQSNKWIQFCAQTGAKVVESGANLVALRATDEFVFYGQRHVGKVSIVSPLQLYLDLVHLPGRGAEAAEEILRREIRPSW